MKDKILIIDDVYNNIKLYTDILQPYNYRILGATSAFDAKKLLQKEKNSLPDLILLDIMMPEESGFDLCRWLKNNTKLKEIPVIFLTAKNDAETLIEGFSLGAVDYITKPFKSKELIARVKTHVELKKSKDEINEKVTQIEQLNETLVDLNQTTNRMFSIIGHDLRGPVGNTKNMIDLVVKRFDKLPKERLFNILKAMGESMTITYHLLENLLIWGKKQNKMLEFTPKELNFTDILNENLAQIQSNAQRKKIQLILDILPNTSIYADENMIDCIVRNLFSNALKYTPQNGKINIITQKKGNYVTFFVKDTGIGIPENELTNISNGIFNTRPGTNNEKGAGMGLKLCYDFVKQNNGTLEIKSLHEKGCHVAVTFSCCDNAS